MQLNEIVKLLLTLSMFWNQLLWVQYVQCFMFFYVRHTCCNIILKKTNKTTTFRKNQISGQYKNRVLFLQYLSWLMGSDYWKCRVLLTHLPLDHLIKLLPLSEIEKHNSHLSYSVFSVLMYKLAIDNVLDWSSHCEDDRLHSVMAVENWQRCQVTMLVGPAWPATFC